MSKQMSLQLLLEGVQWQTAFVISLASKLYSKRLLFCTIKLSREIFQTSIGGSRSRSPLHSRFHTDWLIDWLTSLYLGNVVRILRGVGPREPGWSGHQHWRAARRRGKSAEEEARQPGQLHVRHDGVRVRLPRTGDEHGHHRRVLLRRQDLSRPGPLAGNNRSFYHVSATLLVERLRVYIKLVSESSAT